MASKPAGKVFLVGAGPGDPGLLTLRAKDVLAGAEVLVYDLLANPELLALAPHAKLINAGKRAGSHVLGQDETNALLVRLGRQGKSVVRLKGGDPFVFGRGGEEALALAQAGVPFEVVPGVSSGIAAPAYAGQEPPVQKHVRGYSLVLLMGDTQGSSMPEGLSAPAQKALTDLKDFLPYKSYRLLDTQWLAGSDAGATAGGRLRGSAENEYFPFSAGFSQYNQKFELWAPDGRSILLNGTFTMHVGETVVVGTSRVQGDKALVVLLTIVEAEDVFTPGNGVAAPLPLKMTKPAYTPSAMRARIEGVVRVQCTVLADGTCTDITVVKSLDENGLDQQAVEAVKGWLFKPGTRDGKPVAVRVTVDVNFSLKK